MEVPGVASFDVGASTLSCTVFLLNVLYIRIAVNKHQWRFNDNLRCRPKYKGTTPPVAKRRSRYKNNPKRALSFQEEEALNGFG